MRAPKEDIEITLLKLVRPLAMNAGVDFSDF